MMRLLRLLIDLLGEHSGLASAIALSLVAAVLLYPP